MSLRKRRQFAEPLHYFVTFYYWYDKQNVKNIDKVQGDFGSSEVIIILSYIFKQTLVVKKLS